MNKREATRLLIPAAAAGNLFDVQAALDAGANVNAKDRSGATPLHWAVERDDLDIVKLLLTHGADADVANRQTDNHTPLTLALALACQHTDIAKLLLEKATKRQGHAGRVTDERKDKGPPQVGG